MMKVHRLTIIIILAMFWTMIICSSYNKYGLFFGIGGDYKFYLAQSLALRAGENINDLEGLQKYNQKFKVYISEQVFDRTVIGPTAYPPLFAFMMLPFTFLDPLTGFFLWTFINVIAITYLVVRIELSVPREGLWLALIAVFSFAIIGNAFFGQIGILLGCAMTESFLAFKSGRDFKAGLLLSTLFFKPQYGIFIGPILLWKRRWRAAIASVIGISIIMLLSWLVAGTENLISYPLGFLDQSDFVAEGKTVTTYHMINWRSFLVHFVRLDLVTERTAILIMLCLDLVTAIMVFLAWRGKWEDNFASKFTLLLLATILVAYHSHTHGLALLVLPFIMMLKESNDRFIRSVTLCGLIIPIAIYAASNIKALASIITTLSLIVLFFYLSSKLLKYSARNNCRTIAASILRLTQAL